MIEQARSGRRRAITEESITHRMITSPDVQKIQDDLKTRDQAKRKGKGNTNGKLRKSK